MMNVTKLVKTIETLAPNMEVTVNMIQKGKSTLTGISIGNGNVKPTVYMEGYKEMFEHEGYIVVAKDMIELCEKAMGDISFNVDEIKTWKYAKGNLKVCISPKGTNKDCIVYPYLDLELYVRVTINNNTSYKVKTEMLKTWGITSKGLLAKAMLCTIPNYSANTIGMMMYKMTGDESCLKDQTIIATTKDECYGASIMYHKTGLKGIADELKDDLIIIPSSIHEVLILPASNFTLEQVTEMVREVNENEVSLEEILSDHAYIFHRDTMEITW